MGRGAATAVAVAGCTNMLLLNCDKLRSLATFRTAPRHCQIYDNVIIDCKNRLHTGISHNFSWLIEVHNFYILNLQKNMYIHCCNRFLLINRFPPPQTQQLELHVNTNFFIQRERFFFQIKKLKLFLLQRKKYDVRKSFELTSNPTALTRYHLFPPFQHLLSERLRLSA